MQRWENAAVRQPVYHVFFYNFPLQKYLSCVFLLVFFGGCTLRHASLTSGGSQHLSVAGICGILVTKFFLTNSRRQALNS